MRINTFLPTRNKFIYSNSMKFHRPGVNELLKGIFGSILVTEDFFPQEVVEMFEKVVVGGRQVWRIRRVRQSFIV